MQLFPLLLLSVPWLLSIKADSSDGWKNGRYSQNPNKEAAMNPIEVNMKTGVAGFLREGDMVLTEEQAEYLRTSSDPRSKRQAKRDLFSRWTNNTVYYYFDSSIDENKKSAIRGVLQLLQSRTCINFVESTTAVYRIQIISGNGCWSYVGMLMLTYQAQQLSLGNYCDSVGTIAHEFMHALGIEHMQSRSDRDDYVTIDLTYIHPNDTHNFDKYSDSETINYTPYEYRSIMHYGKNFFTGSVDKLSIIPKDADYLYYMGNRKEPTFYDILMINKHYECGAACPADTSAQCKNGGEPHPRSCAVCLCPSGYHGTLCDQRPPGCGETLTATEIWQYKSSSYDGKSNTDTFCTFWINTPETYNMEIQFVDMTGAQCLNDCSINGVEIIKGPDTRMTYPKYCCPEFTNRTILSSINPTPLFIHNYLIPTNFTFKYRAVPVSTTLPTTAESKTTEPPTTEPPTTEPPTTEPPTTDPPTVQPTTRKPSTKKCRRTKSSTTDTPTTN